MVKQYEHKIYPRVPDFDDPDFPEDDPVGNIK